MACYVRAIGEKHDLGPAEHTVAIRGLFDSTLPLGIHFFVFCCHDSCGRAIGFRDKTPFLSVFLGRSRSHRVTGNCMFETPKNTFMKHPKSAQTPRVGAYWDPARRFQKNENLRFVG